MRKIILLTIGIIAFNYSFTQQRAITERGKEVVLYDDGSWGYLYEEDNLHNEIPTNSRVFKKNDKATFLVKSNRVPFGFYIDPKKWEFSNSNDNPDVEYMFQLRSDDLYAMVITEKIEIPLTTLKSIALENGRIMAPDLRIVDEEYRLVNDTKILLLHMEGTLQGIKATYYGYYFSNKNGTVQFVTFTAQNLFPDLKDASEYLLNGLIIIDE